MPVHQNNYWNMHGIGSHLALSLNDYLLACVYMYTYILRTIVQIGGMLLELVFMYSFNDFKVCL